MNSKPHNDPNIVCPITGSLLTFADDALVSLDEGRRYGIDDGILRLFVNPDETSTEGPGDATEEVQEFYTDTPFPNYNDFDDVQSFVVRANQGVFARWLREQVPPNSNILEVGCGTGQLSNFLAATTGTHIYAADMTLASLRLGVDFAARNKIQGINFIQMNLFHPAIAHESMDVVISNGVLHHTADTKAAYRSIARLVKPGGYILVGLYNKIGRLRTDLRRHLYRLFGEKILFLDPHLRKDHSPEKRRAWIQDQYCHPEEHKHTMSEVLEWFDETGFQFVSSIPKIVGSFTADEKLFEPKSPGSGFDRTMAEIEMLFSHYGGEGGLYIMIGQKVKDA